MGFTQKFFGAGFVVGVLLALGCSTEANRPAEKPEVPQKSIASEVTPQPKVEAVAVKKSEPVADAPYWPCFNGPSGTNISTETGLLASWPKEGPELVWKYEGVGDGFAGITTAEGRIFTAGNIGEDMVLTALDINGQLLWKKTVGKAWTINYPGSRGTPTIDGDRLYYETPLGKVVCLAVADGREIWSTNIIEEFSSKLEKWALAESVLIDGNRLIVSPGGPKASVIALDKMTGKLIWKAASPKEIWPATRRRTGLILRVFRCF